MMDPSEINSFEEQWKKAFQEVSETPPPSVWDGIETHLDKAEGTVAPLWWRAPRLWYAAASVAAILLVGIGVWHESGNSADKEGVQIASNTHTELKSEQAGIEKTTSDSTVTKRAAEEITSRPPVFQSQISVASTDAENGKLYSKKMQTANRSGALAKVESGSNDIKTETPVLTPENNVALLRPEEGDKPTSKSGLPADNNNAAISKANQKGTLAKIEASSSDAKTETPVVTPENNIAVLRPDEGNKSVSKSGLPVDNNNAAVSKAFSPNGEAVTKQAVPFVTREGIIVAEVLTPVGFKDLDVYVQKRYVFFRPNTMVETPVASSKKKEEYYAAVSLMPASFNPGVKVVSPPSAFANANASKQSMTGNSHSGASYAVQTQGGKRLSKHWSLETGLSYLQGNSSYEGGGYLVDAATSRSQNVLQSAFADKLMNYDKTPNSPAPPSNEVQSNTLYIDLNKQVRNDYRFLQVPIQAGFTLNPDKKLSYAVLGGMMANFFINNEIESAYGTVITTKASDDVYRSLNWAATTGLRFNYRLSEQWRATLTGSYQKSLMSGYKSNEILESHPYLYGISWGVRFSF